MGNSVAPAPAPGAAPLNSLLSSTAELDDAAIVSSPDDPAPTAAVPQQAIDVAADAEEAVHVEDLRPQQLLFYAAEHGDCSLIRKALDGGAQVSAPDLGVKALEEEKRAEEEKAGRRRTKAQQDSESVYRDLIVTRDAALHKAAARGHMEVLALLLQGDADLEAKNVLGSTPLHRAVACKHVEAARYLLEQGSQLDATNAIGNTALHIAAYLGELDMANLLLAHAKHDAFRLVVAINHAGISPVDYARKKAMHALLSSHRMAISHHSSFVDYAVHTDPMDTPKDSSSTPLTESALAHHNAGDAEVRRPSLSGPATGGRIAPPLQRVGSSTEHPPSSHAQERHHHHAPNPPLASSNSQSTSTSRSHTIHTLPPLQSSEQPQPQQPPAQPERTHAHPPLSSSSSFGQLPAVASTSPTLPSLQGKPSFDKVSSLDAHVEESLLGSMVSPLVPGDRDRAATLSALTISMALPNECETGEEEKEQAAI